MRPVADCGRDTWWPPDMVCATDLAALVGSGRAVAESGCDTLSCLDKRAEMFAAEPVGQRVPGAGHHRPRALHPVASRHACQDVRVVGVSVRQAVHCGLDVLSHRDNVAAVRPGQGMAGGRGAGGHKVWPVNESGFDTVSHDKLARSFAAEQTRQGVAA